MIHEQVEKKHQISPEDRNELSADRSTAQPADSNSCTADLSKVRIMSPLDVARGIVDLSRDAFTRARASHSH